MKHIVGVSEMVITTEPEDVIVTHSLGSCIGISAFDPLAVVGGVLHFQLPLSKGNAEKAAHNPFMYADTGIPAFFIEMYAAGAEKKRMVVKVAGGAKVLDRNDFFKIGYNNYIMTKKVFWKNGIFISGEDVGGEHWRTMTLEMNTGRVHIKNSAYQFYL